MTKRQKKTPCEKCPLYPQKERFFVPGQGDLKSADLLLIGEAPEADEAQQHVPFVGRAGQLLRWIIADVLALFGSGLPESEVATPTLSPIYITNAVKCWPGEGNPTPPSKSILLCREAYLDKELEEFGGKKIVMLGGTATHSVLRRDRKISDLIGDPWEENGKYFCVTWHPALYFYRASRQVLLDIKRVILWGLRKS